MTVKVRDLIAWLETLDINDIVSIDEGSSMLRSEMEPDACIEIGGDVDEEFEDE